MMTLSPDEIAGMIRVRSSEEEGLPLAVSSIMRFARKFATLDMETDKIASKLGVSTDLVEKMLLLEESEIDDIQRDVDIALAKENRS